MAKKITAARRQARARGFGTAPQTERRAGRVSCAKNIYIRAYTKLAYTCALCIRSHHLSSPFELEQQLLAFIFSFLLHLQFCACLHDGMLLFFLFLFKIKNLMILTTLSVRVFSFY